MLTQILVILASLALLTWSADRFVPAACATARLLGVTPLVIGVTIVGFGTSAPELLIAGFAAAQGNPAMAVGNALGSNIANIALIAGVTALLAPLTVSSQVLRRELPVVLASAALAGLLLWDLTLDRLDGLLLTAALVLVMSWFAYSAKRTAHDPLGAEMAGSLAPPASARATAERLIVSLAVLLVSARALVWGATGVAQALGVSDLVIGLSVVAIGTSLPELAASIAAALQREHDIALGNVIGSNIFNALGVLAVPGLLRPGQVPAEAVWRDLPLVLMLSLALLLMARGRGGAPGRINRIEGAVLVAVFAGYQYYLLRHA